MTLKLRIDHLDTHPYPVPYICTLHITLENPRIYSSATLSSAFREGTTQSFLLVYKTKNKGHGACGLPVLLLTQKELDRPPLGRKDWVVPCGTDDSGRNRTAPPFTSRILYNEDGQLFHRLATPTDCPTCQDGSQHGAAASPWNGISVNEVYERTTVHFRNDATRTSLAAFACAGAQSHLHHRKIRHGKILAAI